MSALLLLALFAQAPESTREERVLALLSEACRGNPRYYGDTIFEATPAPLGDGSVLVPRVCLSMCGTRDHYALDGPRARRFARELCAIYGLFVEVDQRASWGSRSAVLDGLDESAAVGFEPRGRNVPESGEACYRQGEVEPEEDAEALDGEEFARLAARGVRLYVADLAVYRSL